MPTYKTPGVYIEEASALPPSVAEVSTAIPAFIGYTEKNPVATNQPVRISTFLEYKELFGGPQKTAFEVTINSDDSLTISIPTDEELKYQMYYCLDLYFKNGGGPCYIVSAGGYVEAMTIEYDTLKTGLDALEKKDEPTLIVFTEAVNLDTKSEYYDLCNQVLTQCNKLGDRFGIFDVLDTDTDADDFRNAIRTEVEYLKYGAAYTPYLRTTIPVAYNENEVTVKNAMASYTQKNNGIHVVYTGNIEVKQPKITINKHNSYSVIGFNIRKDNWLDINCPDSTIAANEVKEAWDLWKKTENTYGYEVNIAGTGEGNVDREHGPDTDHDGYGEGKNLNPINTALENLKTTATNTYNKIRTTLSTQKVTLPPASAMAGIYAATDRNRGVWKAPANVSVVSVSELTQKITGKEQEDLNVDGVTGKSINAIRRFTGKGMLVWGARTLAGNSSDWRYISVRRLFNTIEKSCKKATAFAVFEPNYTDTWIKVKSIIDSYLYGLWQQGALAGAVPGEAYFVNVGLGKTMTSQDILDGRMIVETGIAAVRPAEFIILRFSHKLQES